MRVTSEQIESVELHEELGDDDYEPMTLEEMDLLAAEVHDIIAESEADE